MAYGDNTGTWIPDPWSGELVWVPNNLPNNTTTKKTALDYITTILSGANNILGQLFPFGLNNSGAQVSTVGYVPTPTPQNSNNNTLLLLTLAAVAVYFLMKDKK